MDAIKEKQVAMHKDFHERCRFALENGFYMEAILMEYAAMESRFEAMLGVLGLPCGKYLEDHKRKDIQISHRIQCLKHLYKNNTGFQTSKIDTKFWKNIDSWIEKRNRYIHGLYKNEVEYSRRISGSKELAENGFEYCKLLYNETKRLRRYLKKYPDGIKEVKCASSKCNQNKEKINGSI